QFYEEVSPEHMPQLLKSSDGWKDMHASFLTGAKELVRVTQPQVKDVDAEAEKLVMKFATQALERVLLEAKPKVLQPENPLQSIFDGIIQLKEELDKRGKEIVVGKIY